MHLTGIDEDEHALQARVEIAKDLDAYVCGDLHAVDLEPEAYDLVHSSFVLEHVHGAEQVLDRLTKALRPGGLMVLKIPGRDTVWGWVTRSTPHWVHVKYKRLIQRKTNAGKPGHGPYPVAYDHVISAEGITVWAHDAGLAVVDLGGENGHLGYFGRLAPVADLGFRLVAALSFGRLTARYSNLYVVLAKP